jgi:uncharacterized protein (TIGR02266 family)
VTTQKRTSERFARQLPIEYGTDGSWHEGTTRNVSLGGVFVECATRFAFGTKLTFRFRVPTQKEPIEVGGQVRWADHTGMGVRFDGLRARDVWALGKFFELPEPHDPA